MELEFICLDKNLVDKIKKLFKDCKVHINKIISFQYSQKLFKSNYEDVTMCVSARRLINERNKSEVHINEISPRNPALFDKIFNLFEFLFIIFNFFNKSEFKVSLTLILFLSIKD